MYLIMNKKRDLQERDKMERKIYNCGYSAETKAKILLTSSKNE